jgi:hypothetical protein
MFFICVVLFDARAKGKAKVDSAKLLREYQNVSQVYRAFRA